MHDRRQLLCPREDWPLVKRVALTIATGQLIAFLTVGAMIVQVDPIKLADSGIAPHASSTR